MPLETGSESDPREMENFKMSAQRQIETQKGQGAHQKIRKNNPRHASGSFWQDERKRAAGRICGGLSAKMIVGNFLYKI